MSADAGKALILVVDDEDDVRELVREILRTAGFDSLPADGDQAIKVLERHPQIDLILTDVMMPGTEGPMLARRVAAERPGLPVLFMTGYPPETLQALGMLPPGELPIPKPFPIQELIRKVRSALGQDQ